MHLSLFPLDRGKQLGGQELSSLRSAKRSDPGSSEQGSTVSTTQSMKTPITISKDTRGPIIIDIHQRPREAFIGTTHCHMLMSGTVETSLMIAQKPF